MEPRALSDEWLAHCDERSLQLRRCDACNINTFVLRQYCSNCLGEMRWQAANGSGTIFAFSVVHRSQATGAGSAVPYTVAYVEVDGALLFTNVRHGGSLPEIGGRVALDWAIVENRPVPVFVSAEG
jgi:uncharacterized OB-fold protein